MPCFSKVKEDLSALMAVDMSVLMQCAMAELCATDCRVYPSHVIKSPCVRCPQDGRHADSVFITGRRYLLARHMPYMQIKYDKPRQYKCLFMMLRRCQYECFEHCFPQESGRMTRVLTRHDMKGHLATVKAECVV